MRQFFSLFALSTLICQTPAFAQSLAGNWQAMGDEGPNAQLTLDRDGGFVLSWEFREKPLRHEGVWQRRGDIVIFSWDPLDIGPTYRLLSAGPWNEEAEQAALSAQQAAIEADMQDYCPWLGVSDVASAIPAQGGNRISAAEAHKALEQARLAAEALSVAAQRAAPNGGYADRDAIRHAVEEAKRYAKAWGRAKAIYSAAGLALPNRPEPRIPEFCRPQDVTVEPHLVAVHVVPFGGSQVDLSDDLTVAFRLPSGERQERLRKGNWAFTSAGRGGPINSITFYGAGIPSETVAIPPEDNAARIFTIETNLQALANGPRDIVVSVRDNALLMYQGAVRFVRTEGQGDAQSQENSRNTEASEAELGLRLTESGAWPDAHRARFLQSSDDPHACTSSGIFMAPPPGRPAAPNCAATSDPENRFVALDIGVPDGDVQPDGLKVVAVTDDGTRLETTTRSGVALVAAATGTSLTELKVMLPNGRSAKLALPEQWRRARYFRLTLPRATLR